MERIDGYHVKIKSFPVNITINDDVYRDRELVRHSVMIDTPGITQSLELAFQPLSSFSYNTCNALNAIITLDSCDSEAAELVIIQFLPMGSVNALFFHPLKSVSDIADVTALRDIAEMSFKSSLNWSGLVFDVIEAAHNKNLIAHSSVAPFDMLTHDGKPMKTPSRDEFIRKMAWRAWASNCFVKFFDESDRDALENIDVTRWPAEDLFEDSGLVQTKNGWFQTLFDNGFGWIIDCSSVSADLEEQNHRCLSLDSLRNFKTFSNDVRIGIAHELEPVSHAIAMRSICASGIGNVKVLSREFSKSSRLSLSVEWLRRYVSGIRLWILTGREYEEASRKVSRRVYNVVCENLRLIDCINDLRSNLADVAEEIQVVHAERNEHQNMMLNLLAFILTGLFGVSAIIDIVSFLAEPVSQGDLDMRLVSLAGYVVAFAFIAVIMSLRSRKH